MLRFGIAKNLLSAVIIIIDGLASFLIETSDGKDQPKNDQTSCNCILYIHETKNYINRKTVFDSKRSLKYKNMLTFHMIFVPRVGLYGIFHMNT